MATLGAKTQCQQQLDDRTDPTSVSAQHLADIPGACRRRPFGGRLQQRPHLFPEHRIGHCRIVHQDADLGQQFGPPPNPSWGDLLGGNAVCPAPDRRDAHLDEPEQVVSDRGEGRRDEAHGLELAAMGAQSAEIRGAPTPKTPRVDELTLARDTREAVVTSDRRSSGSSGADARRPRMRRVSSAYTRPRFRGCFVLRELPLG